MFILKKKNRFTKNIFENAKFGDKVLVRDSDTSWRFDTFSCYRENSDYPYMCIYAPYEQCIPLNEHTWNLLGTTDEYKEETTD